MAHMAAIQQGPISIALDASSYYFQSYTGGVLNTSGCGTSLDHAVLLVGYGTLNGVNYWLVKNSWGANWGAAGYIMIARDSSTSTEAGVCGMLSLSSIPTVA